MSALAKILPLSSTTTRVHCKLSPRDPSPKKSASRGLRVERRSHTLSDEGSDGDERLLMQIFADHEDQQLWVIEEILALFIQLKLNDAKQLKVEQYWSVVVWRIYYYWTQFLVG